MDQPAERGEGEEREGVGEVVFSRKTKINVVSRELEYNFHA